MCCAAAAVGIIALGLYVRKHKKLPFMDKFNPDELNWPSSGVEGATGSTYPYGNYAGNGNGHYPLLR
jgi:hypothetical protein